MLIAFVSLTAAVDRASAAEVIVEAERAYPARAFLRSDAGGDQEHYWFDAEAGIVRVAALRCGKGFASVGYGSREKGEGIPPDSMMGVQIIRNPRKNRIELTLVGGLRTWSMVAEETPAASFRVTVFPDLATMESDTTGEGEGSSYDGEITFGRQIHVKGGFSVHDFVIQEGGEGVFTARSIGSVVKLVKVPDVATAVVRLVADAGGRLETKSEPPPMPDVTMLMNPRPNPALRNATFRFSLTRRLPVRLVVYDVRGRRVATPVDGVLDGGWHDVTWAGTDASGHHAGSGTYFVRFEADDRTFMRRFVLIR